MWHTLVSLVSHDWHSILTQKILKLATKLIDWRQYVHPLKFIQYFIPFRELGICLKRVEYVTFSYKAYLI